MPEYNLGSVDLIGFRVSLLNCFGRHQELENKTTAYLIRRRSLVAVEISLFTSALAEITSSKNFVSEKAPWRLQRPVAVPSFWAAPDADWFRYHLLKKDQDETSVSDRVYF
jgi:hypothetical protein